MTRALSDDQARWLRLRSQRLTGPGPASVPELVRAVGAVQAQHPPATRLALRPRTSGLDLAAVASAWNERRSVVRTWLLRGTLHAVAAEDLGWLLALLGPRFAAAGRRRRRELGLDDELCERGLRAIRRVLAATGPLDRAELVRRLADHGVVLAGQARAHLVALAALRGVLCRGPDREHDEPTYVLVDRWLDGRPAAAPDEPLAELARRHVGGHGPAGARDLAAWAGLPAAQARRGLELIRGELEEVRVGGEPAWVLASTTRGGPPPDGRGGPPLVRLLPQFDAWLLAYRDRGLTLPPAHARRVQAGGGWVHALVVADGRVVGTWRQERARDRLTILVEPFEPLEPAVLPGLEAEAADLGRFQHAEAALEVLPAGRGGGQARVSAGPRPGAPRAGPRR
ncbi:MAG TPA: winged helix DNA-binding domain-containing protein [Actinomycetes bacterium]|nr:winged helix DNA-binding domain-containing protein [Actinomycetes bacterium]